MASESTNRKHLVDEFEPSAACPLGEVLRPIQNTRPDVIPYVQAVWGLS